MSTYVLTATLLSALLMGCGNSKPIVALSEGASLPEQVISLSQTQSQVSIGKNATFQNAPLAEGNFSLKGRIAGLQTEQQINSGGFTLKGTIK